MALHRHNMSQVSLKQLLGSTRQQILADGAVNSGGHEYLLDVLSVRLQMKVQGKRLKLLGWLDFCSTSASYSTTGETDATRSQLTTRMKVADPMHVNLG